MSIEQIIQDKMARLQELRQYQAHYGPYTPYPIIVEINQLESELGHLLRTSGVRPQAVGKPRSKSAKKKTSWRETLGLSQETIDILASLAFIGILFCLAAFFMMAYFYNLSQIAGSPITYWESFGQPVPMLRPTFTPTVDPNAPLPAQVAEPKTPTPLANSYLPTPAQATDVPTPVPTVTPRLSPTSTPPPTSPPEPTNTPTPLKPPPTPIQVSIQQPNTPTPVPPTPVPAPSYPFRIAEQGNRAFQKTAYHGITIYVAVVSEGNVPVGGYRVVGDHVPSGRHVVSDLSTWHWSVVNCLDCDYVKQGNLKFEPGTFEDGTWNIYLTDDNGQQLSPVVSFSYSADPNQWVWDFVIFRRISG